MIFSFFDDTDLFMFGGFAVIGIAAFIVRKMNKKLSPLRLELRMLPFIFGIVLFMGFFVQIRIPRLHVYPDSSEIKIENLEQAQTVISANQKNLERLSDDLEKFKNILMLFLLCVMSGLFLALYKIIKLLVDKADGAVDETPAIKRPILGLNDE